MPIFIGYPLREAIKANAIPVLPDVGSTNVVYPGLISPYSSAISIIFKAVRSFIDPPGFKFSHFAKTSHLIPIDCGILFNRTKGVLPITSIMELEILIPFEEILI